MKILFLTDCFNGMSQRLWIELDRHDHQVQVQTAISEEVMVTAVKNYKPELIVAPFLTQRIPSEIWKNHLCFIVHPGIKGDRGASSLDWAILKNEKTWGVSILQASEKMDSGPVWAFQSFKMRQVSKSELYRNEVTQAAAKGLLKAIENSTKSDFVPEKTNTEECRGKWNRKITQDDLKFSWQEPTEDIIRKINAADSHPGVKLGLFGEDYYCFGAHREDNLQGIPGEILAEKDKAICIATGDAAVWITHLKAAVPNSLKLPSTLVVKGITGEIPKYISSPFDLTAKISWQEIRYEQDGEIGYLHFDFYNGATATEKCNRLKEAFIEAKKRSKLIVLMGGSDLWCNGIDLNRIENAKDPAQESWENINALNDLILELIQSTGHYIICALQGNAGAGGVSLAISGDKTIARDGIVLNPHTKNMGLYGSEYWTYLLPKRIGLEKALKFTEECLPWGVAVAREIGLIDEYHGENTEEFVQFVKNQANYIINLSYFDKLLQAKKFQRRKDEMNKPLQQYRDEELAEMKANFFSNNNGYNEKRKDFVFKSQTEICGTQDLYSSRRNIYRKRKWEPINYQE